MGLKLNTEKCNASVGEFFYTYNDEFHEDIRLSTEGYLDLELEASNPQIQEDYEVDGETSKIERTIRLRAVFKSSRLTFHCVSKMSGVTRLDDVELIIRASANEPPQAHFYVSDGVLSIELTTTAEYLNHLIDLSIRRPDLTLNLSINLHSTFSFLVEETDFSGYGNVYVFRAEYFTPYEQYSEIFEECQLGHKDFYSSSSYVLTTTI